MTTETAITPSSLMRRSAELGAPLLAISYACLAQGLPFYSLVPVAIVTMFAIVQATLRYFLLEAVKDFFIASKKEGQYWLTLGILNVMVGLGMVELFMLIARPH